MDISGHPILRTTRLNARMVSLEVASIPKDMSTLLAGASDGDGYPVQQKKSEGMFGRTFFLVNIFLRWSRKLDKQENILNKLRPL